MSSIRTSAMVSHDPVQTPPRSSTVLQPDGSLLAKEPTPSAHNTHLGFRPPTTDASRNMAPEATKQNHAAATNHNVGDITAAPHGSGFPKISTNFDAPRKASPPDLQTSYDDAVATASRQLQTQPPHDPPSSPTSQRTQTHDGAATAELGFQPPQKSDRDSPVLTSNDKTQVTKTFAEITARKMAKPPDLFTHSLSAIMPVKDDDGVTVIIPPLLYEQRLMLFQFALIGRIFLPPGSSPRSNEDYKAELSTSFQTSGDWNLLHLGKGYFSLQFRLQEDQMRAARHKSWRFSTGSIHLREWQPNFDPYKESSSTTQLWVRLFHLPTEYWHPEFLVGIFRSVGNVIKLDGNTAQGLVGHFARALVEVDLSKPLPESVRVGLPENLFFVDFSYENIPQLCSFCHFIGHSIDQCRKAKIAPADGGDNAEAKQNKDTAPARKKKKWVQKIGEQQQSIRIVPVGTVIEQVEQEKVETSNSFNMLNSLDSGEEKVPETQQDVGDIMDIVTGGSSLPQDFTKQLLTDARICAMNRQLRSESQDTSAAAEKDTPIAGYAEMDTQSTYASAPSTEIQNEADVTDPPTQGEDNLQPTSNVMQDVAVTYEHAANLETTSPPPAQVKCITKRTKTKRKVTEVFSKRNLRSSTKKHSNSEITPEMIEAYARNQCSYVPGDFLGQPKAKQVVAQTTTKPPRGAPPSQHKQLEDMLRREMDLGKTPAAYVIDPGETNPLQMMDFISRQQWSNIAGSASLDASDDCISD